MITDLINKLSFKFPFDEDEYLKHPFIENYHYHSSFSNGMTTDSPTSNEEYAKKIVEYGGHCIFSGEHGSQGNQFEVHSLSEKYKLHYRHSTEAYWVIDRHENDATNCHMCIIALNDEGRRDINYILSMANIDGFYYKPRIDLELLLQIPKDNVIITSACVAGWNYKDKADDLWLKVFEHFKDNFFLEVQYHNTDKQKALNKHIIEFANKNHIQIICGLDSHYINSDTDNIKREEILADKNIHYEDEDGWFLDYPSFDTIYNRFIEQGILTPNEIAIAMLNTLVFDSNKVSECNFNKQFKIPNIHPNLTYKERCDLYMNKLSTAYQNEPTRSVEREKAIEYESQQFIESNTVDYPLITSAIIEEAVNNQGGVLTTTSRGSSSSFYTNKLIGITTLDRFDADIPIYPERFLTKERVLSGQMPDCDLNISEQEPFVKASRKLLGEYGCYPLMSVGYLKEKSAWKMYARINNVDINISNEISKSLDKFNEDLKYADEDEKDLYRIEDYIPIEYADLFKKSKEYQGIIDKIIVHPCGHLIFDGDIRREIGLTSAISTTTNKKTLCVCAEGKYLDDYGYVKEDFLIVDSVSLIDECWKSIGEKVPTFEELKTLVNNDKKTWDIYANGITCCINQMEKSTTTQRCMKYKPQNLRELAMLISAIRPGFASLLDKFVNREEYTVGEKSIDDLIAETNHWLLFQESIMLVLNFLGLPMDETYGVIKAISKKKYKAHPEKLEELKTKLKKGWMDKIGNLDNFQKVWAIIEASASYSFNSPHAYSMSGDSAYLAYFKAHYTSKFYETAINHYAKKNNKDKIKALTMEAISYFGYKLGKCEYGFDNRITTVDDENKVIYPNMSNIKNMQSVASEILYISSTHKYTDLFFIFNDIRNISYNNNKLNSASIDMIFKMGYFDKFGDSDYIYRQWYIYNDVYNAIEKVKTCKQLNKDFIAEVGFTVDELSKFCEKITEKRLMNIDNDRLYNYFLRNYKTIVSAYELKYKLTSPKPLIRKASDEIRILGTTTIVDDSVSNIYFIVSDVQQNKYGTTFLTLYHINDGETWNYKCKYLLYQNHPCEQGDIIKCVFKNRNKKVLNDKNKWVETDDVETIISDYAIVKDVNTTINVSFE